MGKAVFVVSAGSSSGSSSMSSPSATARVSVNLHIFLLPTTGFKLNFVNINPFTTAGTQ